MAARICRVTSALVRRAGQLPPPWGAGGGCGPEVLGRRQFTTHGAAVWGQATPVRGFAATADEFTIQTPFLSDQVPLADGILGEVEEISCAVGDVVNEGDPLVVIETHKASLFIKAEQFKRIRVTEILVAVGQEVRECQPMVKAVPYPA